ncbi:MAG: DNA topoisomerase (ATP-hydrolyzing) subunit B [Nanoarchaeota archaeon]|nr:DNA topoisomerase (ATP-hydrolyzing) subunit B [Nanoarchaeota archaeon]
MSAEYKAESIKVLEGLEGVRKRPAMYIGSTGKDGLHHLVYEVVDNSIDEVMVGYATYVLVTINKDGSVTVVDDGRGIPVDKLPQYKRSAMEIALTKLHAGGKFEKDAYQISGGLHGVGVSCVNALSKKLIATVKRDGNIYEQEYKIGIPVSDVKVVGKTEKKDTGTTIQFYPDPDIFSSLDFDFAVIKKRLQEIAFLNPNVKIILKDEGQGKEETFHYEGGLMEFVAFINKSKSVLHKPIYFRKQIDSNVAEVAIQYNDGYNENIFGFVNTINTTEGGTHISGFKTALTRAINDYADKKGLLKNEKISGDDTREGLTAIVSLKMKEPQFEGQTKTKLGNSEMKGIVDSMVYVALTEFLEENPTVSNKIAQKVLSSAKAREAAKKARDLVRRKNALGGLSGLPGKLADCSSKKVERTELYIVEGDSAAGCFSGDIKVALADGRNLSFIDLVEEDKKGIKNYCYTIKNDGIIGIAKIENPRLTKRDSEVIKLILNNNQKIICTPNHKFMLRNGGYKEAKDLTTNDSLMPLNKKISKIGGKITIDGYEMVWDQKKKWIFTHLLSDLYNLENGIYQIEQGDARHHIDFNKSNNKPENIIRMPKNEHLILHTEHLEKCLHRDDVKEKARQAHKTEEYRKKIKKWRENPEIKKKFSEISKELMNNPEYKENLIKKFIEYYNSNEEYRIKNNKILNDMQKEYWENPENRKKASEKVKKFFKDNPDAKIYLSNLAKEQWKNVDLIVWRSNKTKEQWTPEFRKKRKESYNKTYYNKTIKLMKQVIEKSGNLDDFDNIRIKNNDNSILSLRTFCLRFFNNNLIEMEDAIKNYNHKIKSINKLIKKIDVYDLEVKDTHNFALTSGVFVHNSSKMARDKEFQAILPLKGKILNVEKSNPTKVLSSEEILNLITAIGAGIKENFDISKLRYNKIIIMTDADVDGAHIRTLLLTFFYRYVPELIENGNIYIAVSPLYRIRKGKDIYVYSDDELKKVLDKLGGKADVQRFKGLGEMNPSQLWDTTMDPDKRILKKVTIEDAVLADQTFTMLMGDVVGPRRKFIEANANIAEIDI